MRGNPRVAYCGILLVRKKHLRIVDLAFSAPANIALCFSSFPRSNVAFCVAFVFAWEHCFLFGLFRVCVAFPRPGSFALCVPFFASSSIALRLSLSAPGCSAPCVAFGTPGSDALCACFSAPGSIALSVSFSAQGSNALCMAFSSPASIARNTRLLFPKKGQTARREFRHRCPISAPMS